MDEYMKVPCQHCPFRSDVTPFLHPERAAELAYSAEKRYNTFPCHKTTEYDENSDDGEMLITENTKECAGFLTLRAQCGLDTPKGFNPSWDMVYTGTYEMIDAYEEEWNS